MTYFLSCRIENSVRGLQEFLDVECADIRMIEFKVFPGAIEQCFFIAGSVIVYVDAKPCRIIVIGMRKVSVFRRFSFQFFPTLPFISTRL